MQEEQLTQSVDVCSSFIPVACWSLRRAWDWRRTHRGRAAPVTQTSPAPAEAFGCGINDLPLTFLISWFEQKAVAVLLSLLALGIKGIRIGPTAPAFMTPNVMKILQDRFDLQIIGSNPEADLREALATAGWMNRPIDVLTSCPGFDRRAGCR